MRLASIVLALSGAALAANEASKITLDGSTGVVISTSVAAPSGEYITYSSTATLSGEFGSITALTAAPSETTMGNTTEATSSSQTLVVIGGHRTTNKTIANATTSASQPVNTQPCNNYPQFCNRRYSNITMVAAHNSPFVRPGNVAANQALDVTAQLDDGIRMRKLMTAQPKPLTDLLSSAIPSPPTERHHVPLSHQMLNAKRGHAPILPGDSGHVGQPAPV